MSKIDDAVDSMPDGAVKTILKLYHPDCVRDVAVMFLALELSEGKLVKPEVLPLLEASDLFQTDDAAYTRSMAFAVQFLAFVNNSSLYHKSAPADLKEVLRSMSSAASGAIEKGDNELFDSLTKVASKLIKAGIDGVVGVNIKNDGLKKPADASPNKKLN